MIHGAMRLTLGLAGLVPLTVLGLLGLWCGFMGWVRLEKWAIRKFEDWAEAIAKL